jgi:hypothetical protein
MSLCVWGANDVGKGYKEQHNRRVDHPRNRTVGSHSDPCGRPPSEFDVERPRLVVAQTAGEIRSSLNPKSNHQTLTDLLSNN